MPGGGLAILTRKSLGAGQRGCYVRRQVRAAYGLTANFRALHLGSVTRSGPPSMREPLSRPEQDDYGTSQTSIRRHPLSRGAMRPYAVAPIHTDALYGVSVKLREASMRHFPVACKDQATCADGGRINWQPATCSRRQARRARRQRSSWSRSAGGRASTRSRRCWTRSGGTGACAGSRCQFAVV
jgi:hypothetical protein